MQVGRFVIAVWAAAFAVSPAKSEPSTWVLDRVVIVMRHGIRPPTKSSKELANFSDLPWPGDSAWGAPPGELTPRGAVQIAHLATDLRQHYAEAGLFGAEGPTAGEVLVWGDGADQRTRETARIMAMDISPEQHLNFGANSVGEPDALFNGLAVASCALDLVSLKQQSAAIDFDQLQLQEALQRLQQIVAPTACRGGPGQCLSQPTTLVVNDKGIKLAGSAEVGASLAEDLMLEYLNGLRDQQFGWGRATRDDLDVVMPIHETVSRITRETPAIASHRGGPLARAISEILQGQPVPRLAGLTHKQRLVVFVGHDTTLSNLAGLLQLKWKLPEQPDPTAPGTAIALERWSDPIEHRYALKVRVFYQTANDMHDAAPTAASEISLIPRICASGADVCLLSKALEAIDTQVPKDCR